MNKNTLKSLIDKYTGDDLSKYLRTLLKAERKVVKAVTKNALAYNKASHAMAQASMNGDKKTMSKATKLRKILNKEFVLIQNLCPHTVTSISGDFVVKCLWCGKVW